MLKNNNNKGFLSVILVTQSSCIVLYLNYLTDPQIDDFVYDGPLSAFNTCRSPT